MTKQACGQRVNYPRHWLNYSLEDFVCTGSNDNVEIICLIRIELVLYKYTITILRPNIEQVHEISNNVVCATSKASDQPAHARSLIRAFASRLSIL